jgi:hypothetical protein
MKKLLMTTAILIALMAPASAQAVLTVAGGNPFQKLDDQEKDLLARQVVISLNFEKCGGTLTKQQAEKNAQVLQWLSSDVLNNTAYVERQLDQFGCIRIRYLHYIMIMPSPPPPPSTGERYDLRQLR